MTLHVLDTMARLGFEEVHCLHDRRSGLQGFMAIHDTSGGPAFGGVRRMEYRDEEEALMDCLRLSQAMSHKCVLAGLPAGGAKIVLLDREDVDWPGAYAAVGRAVDRLGGRLYTGPDVGTGDEELGHMAAETSYVTDPGPSGPGLLGECTAEGVFASMEQAVLDLGGHLAEDAGGVAAASIPWGQLTIVIQGLGVVGMGLARRLVGLGARVLASEIDPERAAAAAAELDLELLPLEQGIGVECDVLAPCALGGILHDLSVERLRCRAVVGGANNVLARSLHGDRLHERGILYVPDFLANAGALIRGTLFHLEGIRVAPEDIGLRVANAVRDVLIQARNTSRAPARVAAEMAEDRLEVRRIPSQ